MDETNANSTMEEATKPMADDTKANTANDDTSKPATAPAPADQTGGGNDDAATAVVVPQLAHHNITQADLQAAIRVLDAVASLHPRVQKRQQQQAAQQKKRRRGSGTDRTNGDGDSNVEGDNNDKNDGLEQYKSTNLRPLRKSLASAFELHKLLLYNGKSENEHYKDRMVARTLKRQKLSESDYQKKYIASTALRRGRVEKLEKLKGNAKEEEEDKLAALGMLVPDGHVHTAVPQLSGPAGQQPMLLEDEKKDAADTTSNDNKVGDDANAIPAKPEPVQLPKLRSCYVCKVRYRKLHHFYDQLCPHCASLNFAKRHQTANLHGKVAVITGSRVKIGYQSCLKLLRSGATVVATTRFPNSAAATYRTEPDFVDWADRLHVYGLDLRDVTGLEAFTRFLKVRYGETGIDILVNNACQTVRRPKGYYTPLVDKEQELWKGADAVHKTLLDGCMDFERVRRQLVLDHASAGTSTKTSAGQLEGDAVQDVPLIQMGMDIDQKDSSPAPAEATKSDQLTTTKATGGSKDDITVPFETTGVSHSAAMSQMVILPEDVGVSSSVLPPGLSDINGHQLDLRSHNSWLLKMDEVSTPEVMECMFINAIAPFVLNSRLKPLMTTPAGSDRPDRYIINVSAMEGKFYRYKMPNHPHTNMAKAALNMMTRTSSEDLAVGHRIFMNSVDTGWINDENPLEKASKIAKTNLFQTPIDEIDAAARILDPIFVGVAMDHAKYHEGTGGDEKAGKKKNAKQYGKFFKDYRETEW